MRDAKKAGSGGLLVPALLFAAILVVSLNAWFAFRSVDVLLESEAWVQHTWEVIYQVELILSSAKDAETGARGFRITGDELYLAPYMMGVAALPGEMDRFGLLTMDNKPQGLRLVEMRAVMEQRLSLLRQGVQLRRNQDDDGLRALVVNAAGKMQMDRLRAIADDMEVEERRLLDDRKRAAERNTAWARFSVGLASGLDFLLIVMMFRYFTRERGLRVETELAAERLAVTAERLAIEREKAEQTAERLAATAAGLAIERSKAERAAEEVLELNRTLEERVKLRTAELETINGELQAFSYSVSHDLRAPLRTIDGFSLALEEDYAEAVDATGRDYIRRVRAGTQRMGQLIDALLQLSRITRAELTRSEVDLSALAETVVGNLKEEGPEREVRFEIEPGLRASADAKLLQVALENLLGNAVKFTAKVEKAEVMFGWDAEQRAWFVRDNGAGFDMHYKDKLFNAFNRLHGDKDFKGSGIGLATVARVVRRHHGRIWAEGVVDRGATFWFTLG